MCGLGFNLGLGVNCVNEHMTQMWNCWPELQIRRKMREIMVREAQTCDLKELVEKFTGGDWKRDREGDTRDLPTPERLHQEG